MISLFKCNIMLFLISSWCYAQTNLNSNQNIKVIEFRNYITKPEMRDRFTDLFEKYFTESQNKIGGYTLGQFRLKGADDHFVWIRGFNDMESRSKFLPEFYGGDVWKEHRSEANSMLVNNDNVYLLKPLNPNGINSNEFRKEKGIVVIDFYIANTKLDKLITIFTNKYLMVLKNAGVTNTTLWVCELAENDFPRLPVFQDKNLMVAITCYRSEEDYQTKMRQVEAAVQPELKNELQDIITTKSTLILYPTPKSFGFN